MANNTEKRITAKMILDSSGFNSSLQGVNANLRIAQSELNNASTQVRVFGRDSENLKKVQQSLASQIELHTKKVDIYKQSIEATTVKMNANIAERDRLKESLEKANTAYAEAVKMHGKESDEAKKARKAVETLSADLTKSEKAIQSNAKSINSYTTNLNKAETQLTRNQGALRKTNTELATNESKWISASKTMATAADKMKASGDKMSQVGSTLTIGVTAPIVGIGAAATKMAMDAVESENLFEVSMGKMADSARAWSEDISKSLGLNAYNVRKNVGTFNVMLTSMGQTDDQALKMSESLTQLSYDMASFYNLKPEEAFEKLKSGISGETEPLKSLGVLINETQVKTYALTNGIIKQGQTMTDAQKVQARFGLIMQATTKAQGDLAKTADSPTNKLRIQSEQVKQLGIELGTKLIPLMEQGLNVIKPIVEWLSNLTDEQQQALIKTLMFSAALGPVVSIAGKVVSVGGGVVGVVGKIAGALGTASVAAEGATAAVGATATGIGGAGAAAGAAALLMNPLTWGVVAVGAAAVGTGYLLSRECIPAVDLFGDEVSAATKKSVTAYMDLDKKVGVSLLSFKANNTKITADIAKDMTTTFEKMGDQIKAGRDKHYTEDLANLTKFYTEQGTINTKEAQDTIAKMKQNNIAKNAEVESYEAKVKKIYETASANHRAITQLEADEVKKLQDLMKAQALQALTESEAEQKAILTRMRLQAKNMSTLQASEVIASSAKQRDETVRLANDQYEKTVNTIARQRDEGVIKSDDQAKKMIEAAQRTRDQATTKAQEMHTAVIDELKKQNEDIETKLDESDGHVKSWWERLTSWFTKNPIRASITTGFIAGALTSMGHPELIPQNYSGTNSFRGGLTTLHEKGYEVYNLPRSTRIYNHEASEDLVLKTAQEVARGVFNSYGGGSFGQQGQMRIENAKISGSLKVNLSTGLADLIDARISADLAFASDMARWHK